MAVGRTRGNLGPVAGLDGALAALAIGIALEELDEVDNSCCRVSLAGVIDPHEACGLTGLT